MLDTSRMSHSDGDSLNYSQNNNHTSDEQSLDNCDEQGRIDCFEEVVSEHDSDYSKV